MTTTSSLTTGSARRRGGPIRLATLVAGVVMALTTALTGAAGAASAQPATDPDARAPLPVPHAFLTGAAMAITEPGAALPGANDWSCRPSAHKPRPVVLVHGTMGGGTTNWATYGPLLHNEGYCVFTLTYGAIPGAQWPVRELGGLSDIRRVSVPQVAEFVDRVLAATGAEQVDLVGHSQGTLVSGLVAKLERPGKVGTVASIAPLWEGTGELLTDHVLDHLPEGRAQAEQFLPPVLEQMFPGSALLAELWSDGTPYAQGVRYLNVATRYEEAIWPYTSGLVPAPAAPGYDVRNVVVQDGCEQNLSEHVAIAADPRAADFVLAALDPDTPREPRCVAIAPVHGPTGS